MCGFEYLDHTADVGLRSRGRTLAEALMNGALGLFHLMVDQARVAPHGSLAIACSAGDPAALFVELLNELLAQGDITGMLFSHVEITSLHQDDQGYHLLGRVFGEPIDLARHRPKMEVKAATYGGLSYSLDAQGLHVLQCILDV